MKKILLIVTAFSLLAAGCNSSVNGTGDQSSGQNSNYQQSSTTPSSENTSSSTNSSLNETTNPNPTMGTNTWQGTLQTSNNSAKGNYMIMTGGRTIYLNTSRDYSTMVGQSVNVNYTGDVNSFTVNGISSAQGTNTMMPPTGTMGGQASSTTQSSSTMMQGN